MPDYTISAAARARIWEICRDAAMVRGSLVYETDEDIDKGKRGVVRYIDFTLNPVLSELGYEALRPQDCGIYL